MQSFEKNRYSHKRIHHSLAEI